MLQKAAQGLALTKLNRASPWLALLGQARRGFAKAAKDKGKGKDTESQEQSSSSEFSGDKLIACVALERLPLIVPPPAPEVLAFQNFSKFKRSEGNRSNWNDQYRRHYPKEFIDALSSSNQREMEAAELIFEPAPRITEADKANDRKSLQRALDRRLFLIVQGYPLGYPKEKLIWHFPERLYKSEQTMRLCAESVLVPTAAKEEDVYFVGNAPCGHFIETHPDLKIKTYKDYAWVTKEELLEYFELDPSAYMKQMLVDNLRVIY
ncbi:hypothetical protein L7F22_035678 [Adiantum nelumboides]|nr:hypothetical protein [Adiantum nelumboides]